MKMSRLCFKLSSAIFKEMSSIKEEIFLLSSIKCVNELKQDMDIEHELSLWNIMIMKFIFSHCTLPFAYFGHHFHHCYCYMKLRNCSDHGIKWVLALHFVHLNNWSKLWFLAGKARNDLTIFIIVPQFYFTCSFEKSVSSWMALIEVVLCDYSYVGTKFPFSN